MQMIEQWNHYHDHSDVSFRLLVTCEGTLSVVIDHKDTLEQDHCNWDANKESSTFFDHFDVLFMNYTICFLDHTNRIDHKVRWKH